MSTGQEFNNRSQGQRLRFSNERAEGVVKRLETQDEINDRVEAQLAQHDRDIKVLKSGQRSPTHNNH